MIISSSTSNGINGAFKASRCTLIWGSLSSRSSHTPCLRWLRSKPPYYFCENFRIGISQIDQQSAIGTDSALVNRPIWSDPYQNPHHAFVVVPGKQIMRAVLCCLWVLPLRCIESPCSKVKIYTQLYVSHFIFPSFP